MTETKTEAAVREVSRALIAIGLLDGRDKERRLAAGMDRADAAIRADERARIVAWINERQGLMLGREVRELVCKIADAIERGEHEVTPWRP